MAFLGRIGRAVETILRGLLISGPYKLVFFLCCYSMFRCVLIYVLRNIKELHLIQILYMGHTFMFSNPLRTVGMSVTLKY